MLKNDQTGHNLQQFMQWVDKQINLMKLGVGKYITPLACRNTYIHVRVSCHYL